MRQNKIHQNTVYSLSIRLSKRLFTYFLVLPTIIFLTSCSALQAVDLVKPNSGLTVETQLGKTNNKGLVTASNTKETDIDIEAETVTTNTEKNENNYYQMDLITVVLIGSLWFLTLLFVGFIFYVKQSPFSREKRT